MLTGWKKENDLSFLNEVSSVPLQQRLRHLQSAFANFFAGRAKYPTFKRKRSGGSAEFTKAAFRWREGHAISDASWGELVRQLEYKSDGYGLSVCGATVRPEQSKSVKAGAMKQKP